MPSAEWRGDSWPNGSPSHSTPLANMSEIEHPMMVDYLQSSEIDARAPLRTFVPFPLIQIAEINMP